MLSCSLLGKNKQKSQLINYAVTGGERSGVGELLVKKKKGGGSGCAISRVHFPLPPSPSLVLIFVLILRCFFFHLFLCSCHPPTHRFITFTLSWQRQNGTCQLVAATFLSLMPPTPSTPPPVPKPLAPLLLISFGIICFNSEANKRAAEKGAAPFVLAHPRPLSKDMEGKLFITLPTSVLKRESNDLERGQTKQK